MGELGARNWSVDLEDHTGVLAGNWVVAASVAAGATQFTVRDRWAAAVVPYVSAADAPSFAGARIIFRKGQNNGFSTLIASVSSTVSGGTVTTTVTLQDAVPNALTAGDTFVIQRPLSIEVTAPENIQEVGGVALPTGQSGNPNVPVTVDGSTVQQPTEIESAAQNALASTTAALAANATYTSATLDAAPWRRLIGTVISDQAGTLYVQQSPDGQNWDVQSTFSVPANDATGGGVGWSVEVVAPYARLSYTNGATAQTVFRLYAWGVPMS